MGSEQHVVYVRDPFAAAGTAPIAVDELRLSEAWAGEAVLLRANRGYVATDAPLISAGSSTWYCRSGGRCATSASPR